MTSFWRMKPGCALALAIFFLAGIAQAETIARAAGTEGSGAVGVMLAQVNQKPTANLATAQAELDGADLVREILRGNERGADIPKDWPDIFSSRRKDEIILPNPASTDSFILFYSMMIDKFGEPYLARLRAQSNRPAIGAVQGTQGVAAGEAAFIIPTLGSVVETTRAKGAPIAIVIPDHTIGVEFQVVVTSPARAKSPNAGRLYTHYVMTVEGKKVFNDDPSAIGIFDSKALPRDYQAPNEKSTLNRKQQIVNLLGF